MASSNSSSTLNFAALDAKARNNFNIKLSRVHDAVFAQPIGIHDVYENDSSTLDIPSIPKHLQLDFFFRNFNDIARGNYRAHSSKSLEVNRAIWYYEVSKQHCLSNRIDVVRLNIILMAFIMISKQLGLDASSLYDTGADAFISAYIEAWLSKTCGLDVHEHSFQEELVRLWMDSGFDLVYFPEKARREMFKAVWQMKQMVSELTTIRPESFYAMVLSNEVPRELFKKEGPMLVLHWVFAKMKKEEQRKEAEAEQEAEWNKGGVVPGVFVDTKPVRMDQSPVTDLLVDIEDGVVEQALPDEVRKPWITVANALKIMQDVQKDFLTEAMERATLGRD
ncbi:uncharacterized protein J4E92_009938 [Alternaria infectoria]|uniref:uncharacterized protein n=1 Tax=Alternaria infectoria TaxID=45303 RepID=UPI00221E9EF3|nr:uncharacterized protein J4E92_009938 [Alternaria infectoria]KAI4913066.1 hypothetical protein J4E92_009938 [Alternaria infectoria]